MKRQHHNRGFVALMSVIIISAILLVYVFTLGASSFLNRINVLDTENKRISLALAEACASTAMLKIAQNASYAPIAGGECVSVSDTCGAAGAKKTCKICPSGVSNVFYARAVYNGAYTNLRVEGSIASNNFSVVSWEETAPYGGPACLLP